jgi:hypothetical protein
MDLIGLTLTPGPREKGNLWLINIDASVSVLPTPVAPPSSA